MNCPTNPRSAKEIATCMGFSGGRSISVTDSRHLTKLGRAAAGSFFPLAVRSLRKVELGEGGARPSPHLEVAMEGPKHQSRVCAGAQTALDLLFSVCFINKILFFIIMIHCFVMGNL
jgi:hypothetical protein